MIYQVKFTLDEIEEIAPLVKKHQDRDKPIRQNQGIQGDS